MPQLRRTRGAIALSVASFILCGASRFSSPSYDAIASRAFVVTDAATLAPFTFDRVLNALSDGHGTDWADTLLSGASFADHPVVMPMHGFIPTAGDGGHWRPAAGRQWSYVKPIAIVNRFDLASANYENCGEYRLIFARRTDQVGEMHVAIETALPNPHPSRGKAGCMDVASFWLDLAGTQSADARRDLLVRFFFGGIAPMQAALDPTTFQRDGRIRLAEISNARPRFRQLEPLRDCATARPCISHLVQVPLDNTPDAALFSTDTARAAAFRRDFLSQVSSLANPDVNRFSMYIDRAYLVDDVDALIPAFNYRLPFRRSLQSPIGRQFREQISRELTRVGSNLTPEDIIGRAETQNCAGCHSKSGPVGGGLVFPNGFESGTHISDDSLSGPVRLSPALEEVFLPYRIRLLTDYARETH